jgi:hypothetical protein
MKKNFKKLLCLLLVLTISIFGFTQKNAKPFQGEITFSITYTGEGMTPMQRAQQASEAKTSYKDNLQRTDIVTPMANVITLTNMDSMTTYILYDMGEQKFAISVSDKEETKKRIREMIPAKIKYFDSTKVIAGYNCKKAIITSYYKNQEVAAGESLDSAISNVYYTEELSIPNVNWNTQYKDMKGVLLEYTNAQNDILVKFSAKEVKKKKLPDLLFKIPSGYQIMTKEEFRAMMGGGGGEE